MIFTKPPVVFTVATGGRHAGHGRQVGATVVGGPDEALVRGPVRAHGRAHIGALGAAGIHFQNR